MNNDEENRMLKAKSIKELAKMFEVTDAHDIMSISRLLKATKITQVLLAHGMTTELLFEPIDKKELMPEASIEDVKHWRAAVKNSALTLAGYDKASNATWAFVAVLIRFNTIGTVIIGLESPHGA